MDESTIAFEDRVLALVLVGLAACAVMFVALGQAPLTDVDEGAFSEATREMLARGDYISPWLLDAPRFDKPVLLHWLQMVAMKIVGIDAWGARLPSAIAGVLWVAATGVWARLLLRGRNDAAFWAGWIACTTLAVPVMSRVATADALLNALLACTLCVLWIGLTAESVVRARRAGRIAAALVAAGLLTKGPIAVLVPGMSLLLSAAWARRWTNLRAIVLDPVAWAVVLVLTLPWYLLQFRAMGMPFIEGFLGKHNIGRFTGTMHGFRGGPFYYPAMLAVSLLPWTPLLVRAIVDAVRRGDHPLRERDAAMVWITPLFVIVFFSFSATKLPHYGFYGLTGVMAAMGIAMADDHGTTGGGPRRYLPERIAIGTMLLFFAAIVLWWPFVVERVHDGFYQPAMVDMGERLARVVPWLVGIGAAGIAAVIFARGKAALAVGSLLLTAMIQWCIVPAGMGALQDPVVEAGLRVAGQSGRVITWELDAPSMSFAAGRVIGRGVTPVAGDTVIIKRDHREKLAALIAREGASGPGAGAAGAGAGSASAAPLRLESAWRSGGIEIVRVVRATTAPATLHRTGR